MIATLVRFYTVKALKPRDLHESGHESDARRGETAAALREPASRAQRPQATGFMAPLVAPDRAGGATERAGDVVLIGPALIDEVHHRIGFGHAVGDRVVGEDDSSDDDDAVAFLGADQAPVVDDGRAGGRPDVGEEVWLRSVLGHGAIVRAGQESGQVWVRTPGQRVRRSRGGLAGQRTARSASATAIGREPRRREPGELRAYVRRSGFWNHW